MYSKDPMLAKIDSNMIKLGFDNHSGFSFVWTMHEMQYLVNYGKKHFLNRHNKC